MPEDKNNNQNNQGRGLVPQNPNQNQGGNKQALAKIDVAKVPADQANRAVSTEVKQEDGGRVNGIDTGLACLIAIAKYYNIPAEYRQLERAYVLEEGSVDFTTLVRAAHDLKLKARAYDGLKESDLDRLVYPIMILLKSGRKVVITTATFT